MRSASLGSRKVGGASMSCLSLSSTRSSGQCWGDPNSSKIYGNISAGQVEDVHEDGTPARIVSGYCSPLRNIPTSIPLPADVRPSSRGTPLETTAEGPEWIEAGVPDVREEPARIIDFWGDMPPEIRMSILRYFTPAELVSCSRVSRSWNAMCFDGQLWASLDTTTYYTRIPHESLVKVIMAAGPFLRILNLRGCIQLQDAWRTDGERISNECRNLTEMNLEDCRINKASLHFFLLRNPQLTHISLRGLSSVTDSAIRILSQSCSNLEYLNISWCRGFDAAGLKQVIKACPNLKDLRVSEISGFDDEDLMLELFEANTLEHLNMAHCTTLNDASLKVLVHGKDPEVDPFTELPMVPPRKLRHLNLSRCRNITDAGIKNLAHSVPDLEALHLSHCTHLTDEAVVGVIQTTPRLTHFELEEMENLTNHTLTELSKADCAATLEHLNLSFCEKMGDTGMLQILKNCPNLRSLDLDNTRVSDLTIMELCTQMRKRGVGEELPTPGLRVAVFDCGNITWAGVREILSNNTHVPRFDHARRQASVQLDPSSSSTSLSSRSSEDVPLTEVATPEPLLTASHLYPKEIVQLKCFHGWQMTVDEHTKRVLRGNLSAASRLERKWADYMMATQEAGVAGAGARRRRRRAREAEENIVDDDDDDDDNWYGPAGLAPLGGRRRRARSGGCVVM